MRRLRAHRAWQGGDKDANKILILEQVSKLNAAADAGENYSLDLEDDYFADTRSHAFPMVPSMPKFKSIPGVVITDPMQEEDAWQTPQRATKSNRQSGCTPELEMRKYQMQELISRRAPVPAHLAEATPITVETPPADGLALVLAKLTELTVGVNELRARQAFAMT